jgi:intraflagellar transport protein 140
MPSPVHQLSWYGGQGTVAVVTDEGVTVLTETVMRCGMCGSLAVIQTDSHTVSIHITGSTAVWTANTDMLIQGLSVGASCFVVWNGKTARVYRVDVQVCSVEALEPFLCAARAMAIADASHITDEALFAAEQGMVKVLNFSGVQKGSISFTDTEGAPEHLDINNCYLVVVTVKGVIQIHDIKKPTRPQPIGSAGKFTALPLSLPSDTSDSAVAGLKESKGQSAVAFHSKGSTASAPNSLKVVEIKVNCKGDKVAILAVHVEGALQVRHRDSRLHVFDHNKGSMHTHDFKRDCRCPVSLFWDDVDERMLSCEAVKDRVTVLAAAPKGLAVPAVSGEERERERKKNDETAGDDAQSLAEVEIVLFFATTEHGLLMQDSFQRKSPCGTMLGFMVPRVYFRNMTSTVEDGVDGNGGSADKVKVYSKVMRDFIGMDNVNEVTKKALLDFSYNLTLGKLDEAYRAVKTIGSVTIWENMAQMCVKTKRLDVAEVCLGNMGHARGAAAVRESRKEGSVELSIGTLLSILSCAGQYTSTAQTAYSITACFSLQLFYWCPS